jgi:hypothetical protein
MTRLPVPGSDSGQWGDILNNYLSQSHNSDGSLKPIPQTTVTDLTTNLAAKANTTDLAPVATSGSYTDLANKPTISTGTDASLLTTGTLADARLPATAQATSLAPAVALSATVTATGRSVLTAADAAAARTAIGAGTSSLVIGSAAGTAADGAEPLAVKLAGDLSGTVAAPTVTKIGGVAVGNAATKSVGTTAGTVAAGDDSRITGALSAATASSTYAPLASPALTGTPTVNGVAIGGAGASRASQLANICRPSSYIATLTVKPDGTGDYTTITGACTAANLLQRSGSLYGMYSLDGTNTGFIYSPARRVRIMVYPGTYEGQVTVSRFIHLVGVSGNPGDVLITSPVFKGALQNGSDSMVENVTIHGTGIYYGLHFASGGVSVFNNCKIISDYAGNQIMGMDGFQGALALFLVCQFTSTNTAASANTNMHGGALDTIPSNYVFVDCTHPSGIQYASLGSTAADNIYILGGSIPSLVLDGSKTTGYVDPASGTVLHVSNGAKAVMGLVAPPLPPSSLRAEETAYYFPVDTTGRTLYSPSAVAPTMQSPVAGRTYYTKMPIPGYRLAQTGAVVVSVAAGTVVLGVAQDDGTGKPGIMKTVGAAPTTTVGKVSMTLYSGIHLNPGLGWIWLAVQFSSASVSVLMSSMMSSLEAVYYQDGTIPSNNVATTPVLMPAGQSAPFVSLT